MFNDYLTIHLKNDKSLCLNCYCHYRQVSSTLIITQTIDNMKQFSESVKLAHVRSYINLALKSQLFNYLIC